jgi:hypothetical protein
MDANHFDTLARSLTTTRSRRRLARFVSGLSLGGLLTALGLGEAAAATRIGGSPCSKDSQCKTGRCLRNDTCSCSARFPKCRGTGTVCYRRKCCTPMCAGKNCGSDGCGGSCGSCTGGTCSAAGVCNCGGKDLCQGACMAEDCTGNTVRNFDDCTCCYKNGSEFSDITECAFNACCSGTCVQEAGDPAACQGRPDGSECSFDEQCQSEDCRFGGFCGGGIGG